jgi:hypothetical protein
MSRRLALALVLAGGCTPDNIEVGEHIDVEIEEGLEPCGDLVGHMDRYIEAMAERWQVDLSDRRYTFRWYTEETYHLVAGCSEGSAGCAGGEVARSYLAPLDHELAHLVSFAVGHPPSFFSEGAAVAFDSPRGYGSLYGPIGPLPIEPQLVLARIPGEVYVLAGAYTRHLIDRFGLAAYLEFYADLERSADLDTIAAAHEAWFGEPLDVTIAAFDAGRRDCEQDRFSFKLLECAAPAVRWRGDSLTLRRGLSCAEDDVVGPFVPDGPGLNGSRASALGSFEVPVAGLYELSAVSDEPRATITLGSCGGCEAMSPVALQVGDGPQRLALAAGPHYFRLDASTEDDTTLTLQLRRVE